MIGQWILQVELSRPSPSPVQQLIGLGITVGALVLLAILIYRTRYAGLPDERKRHATALSAQLEAASPNRIRLSAGTDFRAHRDRIKDLWRDTAAQRPDEPTLREAIAKANKEFTERVRRSLGDIPGMSVRLAEEAIVLAVLGSLAVVSADRWESTAGTGGSISFGYVLDTLSSATNAVVEAGYRVLFAFPFGEQVASLVFAFSLLAYKQLYAHWWLLSIALFVGAILLGVLRKRIDVDGIEDSLYRNYGELSIKVASSVVAIWLSGVVPMAIFGAAGAGGIGAMIGFATAVIAFGWFSCVGSARLYRRVRTRAKWWDDHTPTAEMAAYLVFYRIWGILGVIGATLIPVYLIVLIVQGRILDVVSALGEASPVFLGASFLALVLCLMIIAFQIRETLPELAKSFTTALADRTLRAALFGRGVPFVVVAVVYVLATGVGIGVATAAMISISAGAAARLIYLALSKVRYRAKLYDSDRRDVTRIIIEAWTLEDDDSDIHFVARVNGERLAHSELDVLVDDVIRHSESLTEDGEYEPSLPRQHADDLLEFGIVDEEDTKRKLKKSMKDEIVSNIDGSGVGTEEFEELLDEYPEQVVEEKRRELRKKGCEHGRLVRQGDFYVLV